MTEWYDFSNVKSSNMLNFYSVAEAHGLIYPRHSGENFSFAWQQDGAPAHTSNATIRYQLGQIPGRLIS